MQMNGLGVMGTAVVSQDPQLTYIGQQNNRAVVNGSVAFNRSYRSGEEWKKETTFINVAIYGTQAERFNKLCPKGTPVVLSGYIKTDQWKDKDTQKQMTRHVLVVESFQVLVKGNGEGGGNGGNGGGNRNGGNRQQQQQQPAQDGPPVNAPQEDDLPPPEVDIPF